MLTMCQTYHVNGYRHTILFNTRWHPYEIGTIIMLILQIIERLSNLSKSTEI